MSAGSASQTVLPELSLNINTAAAAAAAAATTTTTTTTTTTNNNNSNNNDKEKHTKTQIMLPELCRALAAHQMQCDAVRRSATETERRVSNGGVPRP